MPGTAPHGQARAVGYVRRSTDLQDRSLGDQRHAVETYAQQHDLQLVCIYVDDAISGTSSRGRGGFAQMIDDARGPTADFQYLLVYDVKRFGRMDNDETGYYRHLLRMGGVEVIYVSENFTGRFEDDLLRPVIQWQARQEAKDLAKVTSRGRISKFHRGEGCWLGGVPPYGFDRRFEDRNGRFLFTVRHLADKSKVLLDSRGRGVRTLGPTERLVVSDCDLARLVHSVPERVGVIKRIFHECVGNGLGCAMIARRLNLEGIGTPYGGQWTRQPSAGLWTYATIRNIIKNPAYAGDIVWNRHTAGMFFRIAKGQIIERPLRESGRNRQNPEDDWLIVRDAHPPIVSRSVFVQANALLKERWTSHRRLVPDLHRDESDFRAHFVLTGLMECAQCGNRIRGMTVQRRYPGRRAQAYRAKMYCCDYSQKGRDTVRRSCPRGTIRKRVLERLVVERVTRWYQQFLEKDGASRIRAAAREQCRMFAGPSADLSQCRLSAEARVLEASAMRFLRDLRGELCSKNVQSRRLAIRRCVTRIRLDLPARRCVLWIRRLPVLGAEAGGLARATIRLPENRTALTIGPKKRAKSAMRSYDLKWHLARKPPETRSLALKTRRVLLTVGPQVRESFHQKYMAYSLGKHFACVKLTCERVLLYLKLAYNSLPSPLPNMRDTTGIGTQTTCELEVALRCPQDLDAARPYIRLAYDRKLMTAPP